MNISGATAQPSGRASSYETNGIDMVAPIVVQSIALWLFPAMMAFAASSDFFTLTIPNRVSLILIGAFFVMAWFVGLTWSDVASHVAASALVLAIAFVCFARGWVGGGDAKLAAATALWFGFDHLLAYFVYASLFGGVLTVLLINFRHVVLPEALAARPWIKRLHGMNYGVPYGIALAAAALVVYPDTLWMKSLGG